MYHQEITVVTNNYDIILINLTVEETSFLIII